MLRRLGCLIFLSLVVGWVIAEIAVFPVLVEKEIETQVNERVGDVASVEADVDSFPLVTRLLALGTVNETTVELRRAVRQDLTYGTVRFELSGVEIDRGTLLSDHPRVTAIDEGRITAIIDLSTLSPLLGRASQILGDQVRVEGGRLLVGRFSAEIDQDLMPCDPDGRVEGTDLVLRCTIHDVPEVLIDRAQR